MALLHISVNGKRTDALLHRTKQANNLILCTGAFMTARRDIAKNCSQATLERFRGGTSDSTAQPDWVLAQTLLADAGVRQCPLSKTPVYDLSNATPKVRAAIWSMLLAISAALNPVTKSRSKAGQDFMMLSKNLQDALASSGADTHA